MNGYKSFLNNSPPTQTNENNTGTLDATFSESPTIASHLAKKWPGVSKMFYRYMKKIDSPVCILTPASRLKRTNGNFGKRSRKHNIFTSLMV